MLASGAMAFSMELSTTYLEEILELQPGVTSVQFTEELSM